ncbi:MAG: hypothetical protein ACREJ3_02555, partial [Polyangiaceae bacterium]
MVARVTGVLAIVLGVASCRGCHDDHPYVPYAVGTALPEVDDDAAASGIAAEASLDAGDPFTGAPASLAPLDSTTWPLDVVTLDAPQGTVFTLAVVRDFDGDGSKDAFAIVRPAARGGDAGATLSEGDARADAAAPAAGGSDPGEVLYYRGPALSMPIVLSPPQGLARDASCTPADRLTAVGEHAVLAEVGSSCPAHGSRAPTRWAAVIAVSRPSAPPTIRLAATIADPPLSPDLSIDADTSDRDSDGRPDVALRVTIEGGGAPLEPGPRVSLTLAWLDRPAGLSRDVGVTEASFAKLAAAAMIHATRMREAPSVPQAVGQVRTLWRATCAEGGAARVVGVAGIGAIDCGAARALGDLGLAEVRAYVTLGDPLRASLALDRAE